MLSLLAGALPRNSNFKGWPTKMREFYVKKGAWLRPQSREGKIALGRWMFAGLFFSSAALTLFGAMQIGAKWAQFAMNIPVVVVLGTLAFFWWCGAGIAQSIIEEAEVFSQRKQWHESNAQKLEAYLDAVAIDPPLELVIARRNARLRDSKKFMQELHDIARFHESLEKA